MLFFDKDYLKDWGLDIDFGLGNNEKEVIEDEIPENLKQDVSKDKCGSLAGIN